MPKKKRSKLTRKEAAEAKHLYENLQPDESAAEKAREADARELRAAAQRLEKHAPPREADIPFAVLQKETALCEILTRRGYDPQQGFIPADLYGIAEYITEIEPHEVRHRVGGIGPNTANADSLRDELGDVLGILDSIETSLSKLRPIGSESRVRDARAGLTTARSLLRSILQR